MGRGSTNLARESGFSPGAPDAARLANAVSQVARRTKVRRVVRESFSDTKAGASLLRVPHGARVQRYVGRSRLRRIQWHAARFVEEERGRVRRCLEIEHVVQCTRDCIERALNSLSVEPVVFNETDNGTLVGDGVIDEV